MSINIIRHWRYYGGLVALYIFMSVFVVEALGFTGASDIVVASTPLPVSTHVPRATVESEEIIIGTPTRISVPRLGLDLPISDGHYEPTDGSWTLSDTSAHFALPSTLPNDKEGNTLIYGHNIPEVFSVLHNLQENDLVYLKTDAGTFVYRFVSAEDYSPDQTDIFSYRGEPQLTLQTCTGVWNQLRRMFVFELEQVR